MKPSLPKKRPDSFTTDTVAWLFGNSGFTTDTERFHHDYRQFHHGYRVLNFLVAGTPVHGDGFAAAVQYLPRLAGLVSGGDNEPEATK